MVELKIMPYRERFTRLLDMMQLEKDLVIFYILERSGKHIVDEMYDILNKGVNEIPDYATPEEKYEIVYGNWIRMAKSSYRFIRQRMGDKALEQFEIAHLEALKHENAGLATTMLKIIKSVSQKSAFLFIVRQILYEMQWFTPFTVSEFTPDRANVFIERCKIYDFPDTDDLCTIGCQSTYSKWIAEQFKVRVMHDRHQNGCTCTLTPMKQGE